MSDENVEIVRCLYDALNRRDWETVFRNAHPDFELTLLRGPQAGTYRGHRRAQGFFEDYFPAFDSFVIEPDDFFEGGDHVVAFVTIRARIKGGSGELTPRIGHHWRIREGTILSMTSFPRAEEALEAAGLRE